MWKIKIDSWTPDLLLRHAFKSIIIHNGHLQFRNSDQWSTANSFSLSPFSVVVSVNIKAGSPFRIT